MKMLRPMFVTGSLVHGGAERHSITVMNRLADRGHQCHAVYIKNDPSQLERINLRQDGTVRCMHAKSFYDLKAIDTLAEHISQVRPSVLVAANGYALMNSSVAKYRARLRIPLVVTFHTTKLFGIKEHAKMFIDRQFFWKADRSVFVCEMQRQYWLRRGVCSRKNAVIYNGVDTTYFSDTMKCDARQFLRASLGIAESDYVISISAVLRPEKNHLQLLDAISELRRRGIPARLIMIGDGPMREAIESRVAALGIGKCVCITGFQEDVRPYISISDVMVLCSLSETFSLAALEAMSMGKPVVLSDVGGAREMLFPGSNGFLFPVDDTEILTVRLAALAEPSVAKRMGKMARSIVEREFSEDSMVDRYENILDEVCAESSPVSKTPER